METQLRIGLPRRGFLAAGLAALLAAGGAVVVQWGQVYAPQSETFRFSRGTALARAEEDRLRAFLSLAVADDLLHVAITGHSGNQGDPSANLELSQARADFVAGVARSMGVASDRVIANGVGGGAPLPRDSAIGDRAYQSALARVDVVLQVRR